MSVDIPRWLVVSQEVELALQAGMPLVALESTVITHGLPRPQNVSLAVDLEEIIRRNQAVPAIAAFLNGNPHLGLTPDQLEQLASDETAIKLNRRDLGAARANGWSGGTTVSATMILAEAGGLQIFATGGIGGVHPGNRGDVSTDLVELARTPVAVVSAGAKAILDLPRTLEWLETSGVPVIGIQTDEFPAFYSPHSGLPVSTRADDIPQAAKVLKAHWSMDPTCGVLVCVPPPAEKSLDTKQVEEWISEAEKQAEKEGVQGKDVTPFLLARLAELSNGATVEANLALLKNNARVAAQLALALKNS